MEPTFDTMGHTIRINLIVHLRVLRGNLGDFDRASLQHHRALLMYSSEEKVQ